MWCSLLYKVAGRVMIVQWYSAGLRSGWSGVRGPAWAGNFSLHNRVQTGSRAHPASYPMVTRDSFPGVQRPGREADHSPPCSSEVKNAWSYTSTPPVRLHGVVLSWSAGTTLPLPNLNFVNTFFSASLYLNWKQWYTKFNCKNVMWQPKCGLWYGPTCWFFDRRILFAWFK
jgi:hypothetical protein